MKCVICKHNNTIEGIVTVTLNRENSIIIIKNVPADICENCGEYYLSSEMTKKILEIANESLKKGVEIEIIKFAA